MKTVCLDETNNFAVEEICQFSLYARLLPQTHFGMLLQGLIKGNGCKPCLAWHPHPLTTHTHGLQAWEAMVLHLHPQNTMFELTNASYTPTHAL